MNRFSQSPLKTLNGFLRPLFARLTGGLLFVGLFGFAMHVHAGDVPTNAQVRRVAAVWAAVPGWSGNVIVRFGPRLLLSSAQGQANVELGVRNMATTRFKLFSVSKQFTAMAAVQLAKDKRLDLDAPIKNYLHGLPSSWDAVTMRELLQHTAGIPQQFEESWSEQWENDDAQHLLPVFNALLAKLPAPEFAPGTKWKYSNMGYIIAGCVIEAASGEPFETFVAKRVFEPFGLKDTLYDSRAHFPHDVYSGNATVSRLAGGYNGSLRALETAYSKEFEETPAGGVISTVGDLDRYGVHYLALRRSDPAIAAMEEKPYRVDEHFAYGLGWEMIQISGHQALYHSGGSNGFVSELLLIPDVNIVVSVTSNHGFDDVEKLSRALAEAALYGSTGMGVKN
ncbi:MAG: beta-lactamase family protein [Acidobacteriota bacterium]|nr:beta-lactamase family protein [Acidobacteriota bacterium]